MSRWLAAASVALLLSGGVEVARGGWIIVKAMVAQQLLEEAWDRARSGIGRPVPWPWADTWPVARLEVPKLGIDQIVLEGASGAVLAFGPGHLAGSAMPGSEGNAVLAGHRDTHFGFLRELLPGDSIRLQTPEGGSEHYRVEGARIVREDEVAILEDRGQAALTLVTCFPFEAADPGGELRYVVWAVRLPEGQANPTTTRIAHARKPVG